MLVRGVKEIVNAVSSVCTILVSKAEFGHWFVAFPKGAKQIERPHGRPIRGVNLPSRSPAAAPRQDRQRTQDCWGWFGVFEQETTRDQRHRGGVAGQSTQAVQIEEQSIVAGMSRDRRALPLGFGLLVIAIVLVVSELESYAGSKPARTCTAESPMDATLGSILKVWRKRADGIDKWE
jgi:hypothetical protein